MMDKESAVKCNESLNGTDTINEEQKNVVKQKRPATRGRGRRSKAYPKAPPSKKRKRQQDDHVGSPLKDQIECRSNGTVPTDGNCKIRNYVDEIIEQVIRQSVQSVNQQNNFENSPRLYVNLRDIVLDRSIAEKYKLTKYTNGRSKKSKEMSVQLRNQNRSNIKKVQKTDITENNIAESQVGVESNDKSINFISEIPNLPCTTESSPTISENSRSSISTLSSRLSSGKSQKYAKVVVNNHQSSVPFNIKINVGNNQLRKVEFAKEPISTFWEPAISPSNFSVDYNSPRCNQTFTNDTESIPILQFYSGDWFFDICDENLHKILSSDSIFRTAELPSANAVGICSSSPQESPNYENKNCAFQFTKPTLPPAKRPPTRKKMKHDSTLSDQSSIDSSSVTDKFSSSERSSSVVDDDAISLYSTWSIKSSDFCTKSTGYQTSENDITNETRTITTLQPPTTAPVVTQKLEAINTNVDDVLNLPEIPQKQNVMQWLEKNPTNPYKVNSNFYSIPEPFRGLCYYYFTFGNCSSYACRRIHRVNKYVYRCLNEISHPFLLEAYRFAKARKRLLYYLTTTFIQCFIKFNDAVELLDMVNYVLDPQFNDIRKIINLRSIINGLEASGRSFTDCVEEIMLPRLNDISLSNALLEIIVGRPRELHNNWYLIERLCRYRNNFLIETKIVNRLLYICSDGRNFELSRNLVKDIFMRNCVDLSAIDKPILYRFISFLQHEQSVDEINYFSQNSNLITDNVTTFPNQPVWLEKPFTQINSEPLNNVQESFQSGYHFVPVSSPKNFHLPRNALLPATVTQYDNAQIPETDSFNNGDNEFVKNKTSGNVFNQDTNNCNDHDVRIGGTPTYSSGSDIELVSATSDTTSSNSKESIPALSVDENVVSNSKRSTPTSNKSSDCLDKSLCDYDIKQLSDIIDDNNIEELIVVYNKLKNSVYNHSFAINVIGFLKQKTKLTIHEVINGLIDGLEKQNAHFAYLNNAESTLYMLVVNIIALLKQMKAYNEAARLLSRFNGNLENLLNVQWCRSIQRHSLSIVGKYLYCCQVYMRGELLEEALNLLKSPELKLLHPITSWTLKYNETFDNEFRNNVVEEFVKIALKENLKIAKDIILYMISSKDNVTELNLWSYFDQLILALLDSSDQFLNDLVQLLPNILQGWYKYLRKSNMRGLLVKLTSSKIPEKQLLTLYNKCLKQQLYCKVKGNENTIILKTDMTIEEIFVSIRYYLYKLEQNNYEIPEVQLIIKLPKELSDQPQVLINSDYRLREAQNRILTVLASCFPTAIAAKISKESRILIKPDQLKMCVEYYKKINDGSNFVWVRQSAVEKLAICDTVPAHDSFSYTNKLCSR